MFADQFRQALRTIVRIVPKIRQLCRIRKIPVSERYVGAELVTIALPADGREQNPLIVGEIDVDIPHLRHCFVDENE